MEQAGSDRAPRKPGAGRRIAVILAFVIVISLILFGGYALRNVYRYESAVSLLRDARYAEAADAFEALGAYRDAPSYAMYSRAADAGEKGSYLTAAENLRAMDGFGDSAVLSVYYEARAREDVLLYEDALTLYSSVSLYRDAGARMAALPGKILERDYASAAEKEERGALSSALLAFRALGDYRDSASRAEALEERIAAEKNEAAYARAEAALEEGRFADAREAFLALGGYRDSAERAGEAEERRLAAAYAAAEAASERGDVAAAYEGFSALEGYRDSADRAGEIRNEYEYLSAGSMARRGDYIGACARYEALGDYRDSAEKARTLRIARTAEMTSLGGDLAAYSLGGRMGLVNLDTCLVTAASYESISPFAFPGDGQGYAKVSLKGRYGFIDADGIERIPPIYTEAGDFNAAGLCRVRGQNKMYGYIGRDGGEVIPCVYSSLSDFSDGVCAAAKDGLLTLIGTGGETLTPDAFRRIGTVSASGRLTVPAFDENGLMTVQDALGGYRLMDSGYRLLGEESWDEIGLFSEGLARVKSGGEYGFIDTDGTVVIAPEWPYADRFSEGLCAVGSRPGLFGFIDRTGEMVIPAVYDDVSRFSDGEAPVYMEGIGWFMIDRKGENTRFAVIPYEQAAAALERGDYAAAAEGFGALGSYADSYDRMLEAVYRQALEKREAGELTEALEMADHLGRTAHYRDSEALTAAIRADILFESGKTAEAWQMYAGVDEDLRRHTEDYARLYAEALDLLEAESYDEAIAAFRALGGYADSAACIERAYDGKYRTEYTAATELMEAGDYDGAAAAFGALGEYSRARDMALECRYRKALQTEKEGGIREALRQMTALGGYGDAASQALRMQADILFEAGDLKGAWDIYKTLEDEYVTHAEDYAGAYREAEALLLEKDFDGAEAGFAALGGYSDSAGRAGECREGRKNAAYEAAAALLEDKRFDEAAEAFLALGDYRDSGDMVRECVYQRALKDAEDKNRQRACTALVGLLDEGDALGERIAGLSLAEQCLAVQRMEGYRDSGAQLCRITAEQLFEEGDYASAWILFSSLDTAYRTRDEDLARIYRRALDDLSGGRFDEAERVFEALGTYMDSAAQAENCREGRRAASYDAAAALLEEGRFGEAAGAFAALGSYRDSAEMIDECAYRKALALDSEGKRGEAAEVFFGLTDAPDVLDAMLREFDPAEPAEVWDRILEMKGYKDTPSQICRLAADEIFDSGSYAAAWSVYARLDAVYHTHVSDYRAMYASAEEMAENGDLDAAARAFRALGGYSDSEKRAEEAVQGALEKRYREALRLQTAGEFDAAYDMYASLEGYSDSGDKLLEVAQQKADRLYADGDYSEAAEVYRLLGSEKEKDALWHEADRLRTEGEYLPAGAQWMAIRDYGDSREQNRLMAAERAEGGDEITAVALYAMDPDYGDAREEIYRIGTRAHDREDYRTAVAAWEALGAYKDSGMNLTMDTYALGGQLYDAGSFDEAAEVFGSMDGFSNTAQRAQDSAYRAACAALENGSYDDAADRFLALGDYEDSRVMVMESRYRKAEKALEDGEYGDALKVFEALGTYRESRDGANAARYAIADGEYLAGAYEEAAAGFSAISGYRDADTRLQQARYMLYGEALAEERFDEAIAGFEDLASAGYVPAVSEASRSHYLKARALDRDEETEAAYGEYVAAGQYEDAPDRAKKHALTLAEGLKAQGDYPAAVVWYETADDCEDAAEQLRGIGEYYFSVQDWPSAVNAYKTLAGRWDVSDRLCRIGRYYDMQSDPLNAFLAYGYAGEDSEGAERAAELKISLRAEAEKAVSAGKTADAVRIYETLVRIDPGLYPDLIAADFAGFAAVKGRTLRIGKTDWRFLASGNGTLVFIADRVLASKAYDPSYYAKDKESVKNWINAAASVYFTEAERPFVSRLWVMSRDEITRYMPKDSDRKTSGASEVWTSSTRNSTSYYYTYNASSGSMGNYDYEASSSTCGIRPGLEIRCGIGLWKLISGDPDRYAVLENGRRLAFESEYLAARTAAIEAEKLKRYRRALSCMEEGGYGEAARIFTELGDYLESGRMVSECAYRQALLLAEGGRDEEAVTAFAALGGYSDSENQIALARERIRAKRYAEAERLEEAEEYSRAWDLFTDPDMAGYLDSAGRAQLVAEKAEEQKRQRRYAEAADLSAEGELEAAKAIYADLGAYLDSAQRLAETEEAIRARDYARALEAMESGAFEEALGLLEGLGDYRDSLSLLEEIKKPLQYDAALREALSGRMAKAYQGFTELGSYRDSAKKAEIAGNLSRAGKTTKLAEGVLIYEFHDLWGIANLNTNVITPVKYTSVTFERGSRYAGYGLAKVFISGGERSTSYSYNNFTYINGNDAWGYIDMNGREIVPCENLFLTDFDGNGNCTTAKVDPGKDKGYWNRYTRVYFGICDYTGKVITKAQWRTMGSCVNNDWSNDLSIGSWRDNCFTVTLPSFSSGRMKVQDRDGLWGYISEQGKVLGQVKWVSVGDFSDGLCMVGEQKSSGTRYGFIDEQGQTVGEVRWEEVKNFSQGLAAVKENGLWGFIDRTNTLVIPCRYAEVNAFKSDGTCDVRNPDGTWIVINREGNSVFFDK